VGRRDPDRIETRKKLRALKTGYTSASEDKRTAWFFDPFVPDVVTLKGSTVSPDLDRVAWESIPTEVLAREQACWALTPGASWHGFRYASPDWAMTDPNKLTLITPGIDPKTGEYGEIGYPPRCWLRTSERTTSSRRSATSTASCS